MTNKQLPADGLVRLENFPEERLNDPDNLVELAKDEDILEAVDTFRACDKTSYESVAALLNAMSNTIHGQLSKSEEKDLIVYVIVHANNMKHPPNSYFDSRPDLVALLNSHWQALSLAKAQPCWHHILSLVEEKTKIDMNAGPAQCGTYLGLANQARPDMNAMLGISLSPKGYCILYSCPSGLNISLDFGWDNFKPILSYIYTLYCPRNDQPLFDPTISLPESASITSPPRWDIQAGDVPYRNCEVKNVGYPWHRMTWVAQTPGDKPFVIKDSFCHEDTTFLEADLFETIHMNGPAPGFAVVKQSLDVECEGEVITVTVGECTRIKKRLIMTTSGDPLCRCPRFLFFLKAMYDILEAHRWAVRERRVLHRDISHANIIINAIDAEEQPYLGEDRRPKYITEALDRTKTHAPPFARLIDLDNGAKLDRPFKEDKRGPLRRRTGTPRFIARSVAAGELLVYDCTFIPMPRLEDQLLAMYEEAYPIEKDDSRGLNDQNGTRHCGVFNPDRQLLYLTETDNTVEDFEHQPRHDAESIFWCIVVFLLRALPKSANGPEDDANNTTFNDTWQKIANHEIKPHSQDDSRSALLRRVNWANTLHPSFCTVGPLIAELAFQVSPEYELLLPTPNQFNLHEAMQRILFKYIHQWQAIGFDVELSLENARKTSRQETILRAPVSYHTQDGQHLSKRASEALEQREVPRPKRRRTSDPSPDSIGV